MFSIQSYPLAVLFCVITMLCWGSWANTAKATTPKWQFPLFYWDYSLGLILTSLLFGLTLGSYGEFGRSLLPDLAQASSKSIFFVLLSGAVFNLSNLLIVAAISIVGLAIAFPTAVGLALALGVFWNYQKTPEGNPIILFSGVCFVLVAILLNGIISIKATKFQGNIPKKGILISIISGCIMSFFYRFTTEGMTTNFTQPEIGKLTPYSTVLIFSIGLFLSNFLWNSILMYKPITGTRTTYTDYFKNGTIYQHTLGLLGGFLFSMGFLFNLIASEKAGPAISYGLGQGSTLIGAAWGVFVFKEFANAPRTIFTYISAMFICFILGLGLIIAARIL